MTVNRLSKGDFQFKLASGANPHFEFPDTVTCTMRKSAAGLDVVQFPAPYAHIEVTRGERVGPAKWQRIRAAVIALGGAVTGE